MRILLHLSALLCVRQALGAHILRESAKHAERHDFVRGARAKATTSHQITIGVQQRNLNVVKTKLDEVSDMTSPNYGKYLTFEEIGDLVSNPDATDAVLGWLRANKVTVLHTSTHGEYIVAQASVSKLEELFQTEFYEFAVSDDIRKEAEIATENIAVQHGVIRSTSYSVPDFLNAHIAGVMDMISLPPPVRPSKLRKVSSNDRGESLMSNPYATPDALISYYNIYGDGNGMGNQTLYESLNQAFLPSDLTLFQQTYNLPIKPVDNMYGLEIPSGDTCLGVNGANNCAEASLDIQYIMAVAQNVSTTYWYDVGNDYNYKNFIVNVSSFSHPSLVFSISYGTYEVAIDAVDITFFNNEAMKLGLRGVTIVASSGDDGVTGPNITSGLRIINALFDDCRTGFLFRVAPKTFPLTSCGYYASFPASSPYVTAVGES